MVPLQTSMVSILEVPSNSILEFSYIGYITQTLPVTSNVMNIVLQEDSRKLDEVVVVGYGTQAKKDITGSVAVVDTKDSYLPVDHLHRNSCKVKHQGFM